MNSYVLLEFIHILSATILAGTGIGIAFFMYMASRSGNTQAIVITARHVVLADWIFTTPAIIIQFTTGIVLMKLLDYSFTSAWFIAVIALFIFIGCCWIPVVFIQHELKREAESQLQSGVASERFTKLMKRWTRLGVLAFLAIVMLFYLMIFKPLPLT